MNTKDIRLLIVQAEVILEHSKGLKGKNTGYSKQDDVVYLYYLDEIDELVRQYNLIIPRVNSLLEKEGIKDKLNEINKIGAELEKIRDYNILYNADRKLLQLIFSSSRILSFLREDIILSEVTQDRLDYLVKELESIKDTIPKNIYQNLIESKIGFEKGVFLGSSLISGRIIKYCLDKIEGKDINEKIEILKSLNLIEERGGKEFIIKSNHFTRNITSHDIEVISSSSDALSHLGDAVRIAKIISSYEIIKNKKNEIDHQIEKKVE